MSESGEPCPKCGTMMFAYGYGGTMRWCSKCQKWYPATIKAKRSPEEQYADLMWM
jgi:DNA-directed RNA polymerase subunit M/transcription elongation factor TFIIS